MTLSDLASIGTFTSAIAVVISLIYLGNQVRHARSHQQAAIRAERATGLAMMNTAAEEPSIADAIMKGLRGADDLTATQYAQFTHFCRASFYNAEDTYFQHSQGLISDQAFASFIASVKGWAARAPGIRASLRQRVRRLDGQYARGGRVRSAHRHLRAMADPSRRGTGQGGSGIVLNARAMTAHPPSHPLGMSGSWLRAKFHNWRTPGSRGDPLICDQQAL